MGTPSLQTAKRIALATILLCWAVLFYAAWIRVDGYQWDFKSYYAAMEVVARGGNPYDGPALFYPPLAITVLKPLTLLSYAAAHHLWVAVKLVALIALALLWRRVFLPRADWLVILLVGLLAFRAATMVDIKAGNVSVFEQLLLWTGFAAFLRSRFTGFAVCVVAASVFKLTLAVFLLLLWFPAVRSRANTIRFAVSVALLAGLSALPFVFHPEYFNGFIAAILGEAPPVSSNPSAYAVIASVAGGSTVAAWGIAAGYVVALGYMSRGLLRRAWRTEARFVTVMIAAMLYALLAPRMMIYSYMIVLVPVIGLVIPAIERLRLTTAAVVVALCLGGLHILPGTGHLIDDMSPLLLLLACWSVLVVAERSGGLIDAGE
jgi:hypothetical protein